MTESPIRSAISREVDSAQLAGAVALVWRNGAVREVATAGRRDLSANLPVECDTIFRIASVTKPVTTVAALMLLDEGRFALGRSNHELRAGARAPARAARSGGTDRRD